MGRLVILGLAVLGLQGTAQAASLTLEKSPVLLGKTESVGVTFALDENEGDEVRPLRVAVNVGSFSAVQRVSRGKYRSVYVPPPTRFPQVALVAVWREAGPEAPIEFLRIPLYGSTKLPVGAKRGSDVTVVVGELEFGPQKVDADGQIEVAISVPPGVREAVVRVKERVGGLGTKTLPIDVPPYNRVTAALVPHAIVADGQSEARLDVFYDLGGADVPASKLKVTASAGELRFERAEKGRYVYRFRAAAGTAAAEVSFAISVQGDPTAKASAKLTLGQPPAARLVVRPPGTALRADGQSTAPIDVIVFDEQGLGLAGQRLTVSANGAALPAPAYRGNGLYQFTFTAPAEFPAGGLVQLAAKTEGERPVEGAANYQLLAPAAPSEVTARVQPSPVPADGKTAARVRFDVRDAAGLPLPGAKLVAVASHGTLGPLQDEGAGRYSASYQPPASVPDGEALIRVVDSGGTFEKRLPVPMREDPRRLLIGVRAGYTHSLEQLGGARVGLDLSLAVNLGVTLMWASVLATGGMASQTVTDVTGTLSSKSELYFVPLSLKLGFEVWASRRLAVVLGAGGGATWAKYSTTLSGTSASSWGPNALGFAALHVALGPGHVVVEAGYTWAPVQGEGFTVDAGGVGVSLGYRLGVL